MVSRIFQVSGNLQVLHLTQKDFKSRFQWEQSTFYSGRGTERGQGMGSTRKEARGTCPSARRPNSTGVAEWCGQLVLGILFVSKLCDAKFWSQLLVDRGPFLWLPRPSQGFFNFIFFHKLFPLIMHEWGGGSVRGWRFLLLHLTCWDFPLTSFYAAFGLFHISRILTRWQEPSDIACS